MSVLLFKKERCELFAGDVFDSFPLFIPKSKSLPSLLAHSLLFKERLERFAPVALYKRATVSNLNRSKMTKERWMGAIRSFSQANHTFTHKKRTNCSKNWWANSQLCVDQVYFNELNSQKSARSFYFLKIVETLKINTLFCLNCKYLLFT